MGLLTARLRVCAPAQIDEALAAHPHLTLVDLECYADAVDGALLSALRQGRAGVRLLLLSRWGAALGPGALPPARALAAALRGHPTLLRLELDESTFSTEGAPFPPLRLSSQACASLRLYFPDALARSCADAPRWRLAQRS